MVSGTINRRNLGRILQILGQAFAGAKDTGEDLLSFRDVIAGILIGAVTEPWWVILIACMVWGVISWSFVSMAAGKSEYRTKIRLVVGYPKLNRFVVWWSTAFVVSLLFATVTSFIRSFLEHY